jgi:hypothetical protein
MIFLRKEVISMSREELIKTATTTLQNLEKSYLWYGKNDLKTLDSAVAEIATDLLNSNHNLSEVRAILNRASKICPSSVNLQKLERALVSKEFLQQKPLDQQSNLGTTLENVEKALINANKWFFRPKNALPILKVLYKNLKDSAQLTPDNQTKINLIITKASKLKINQSLVRQIKIASTLLTKPNTTNHQENINDLLVEADSEVKKPKRWFARKKDDLNPLDNQINAIATRIFPSNTNLLSKDNIAQIKSLIPSASKAGANKESIEKIEIYLTHQEIINATNSANSHESNNSDALPIEESISTSNLTSAKLEQYNQSYKSHPKSSDLDSQSISKSQSTDDENQSPFQLPENAKLTEIKLPSEADSDREAALSDSNDFDPESNLITENLEQPYESDQSHSKSSVLDNQSVSSSAESVHEITNESNSANGSDSEDKSITGSIKKEPDRVPVTPFSVADSEEKVINLEDLQNNIMHSNVILGGFLVNLTWIIFGINNTSISNVQWNNENKSFSFSRDCRIEHNLTETQREAFAGITKGYISTTVLHFPKTISASIINEPEKITMLFENPENAISFNMEALLLGQSILEPLFKTNQFGIKSISIIKEEDDPEVLIQFMAIANDRWKPLDKENLNSNIRSIINTYVSTTNSARSIRNSARSTMRFFTKKKEISLEENLTLEEVLEQIENTLTLRIDINTVKTAWAELWESIPPQSR